jgi:hypothetical protein
MKLIRKSAGQRETPHPAARAGNLPQEMTPGAIHNAYPALPEDVSLTRSK